MQIHLNENLKTYHTFGIDRQCQFLVTVESVDDLIYVFQQSEWQSLPKMVLGKGSNVLFTADYSGIVIVNRLSGIDIREDKQHYYLHVQGGEDWPTLVETTISQQIPGLENLALIPGCAGSAPIQNIGAYGVEFKDVCQYVDYLCLDSLEVVRITREDCRFDYRDSIFKRRLYNKAIVIGIGLILPKQWTPHLNYGPLQKLAQDCRPEDVFQCVCRTRRQKLPDPSVAGNAGSFFKNPVITKHQFDELKKRFPDIVHYPTKHGVKIAAGWLIDQCQLKGYQLGGAQVHPDQALVLINRDSATAADIVRLAGYVQQCVYKKYGIALDHEVRFIGINREVTLDELLKEYV
jgi:UDP-N-acetylmuramate dehydrogenase